MCNKCATVNDNVASIQDILECHFKECNSKDASLNGMIQVKKKKTNWGSEKKSGRGIENHQASRIL